MIKKVKGTKDYFYEESQKIEEVKKKLEKISSRYNMSKIITPIFEETSLFSRAVGNNTDVVNKEMYTFNDKKGRSISLRPEGTAPTVRMVLENKLLDNNNQPDLFYIANMFRYERPQKGRQREFYQYGVERFGKDSSYVDLETILIAKDILKEFKINKYELEINSIGKSSEREKFNKELKKFVEKKINLFSYYVKEKFESGNLLRIFDSKINEDLELLKDAPTIDKFISAESNIRFMKLKMILEKNNIEYKLNNKLVRGLDYYNDLVFEFISTDEKNLGSKSTIIAGGRYDTLVNKLDETKEIPAIGFALGIERLMLASNDYLNSLINNNLDYFIVCAYDEEDLLDLTVSISKKLREKDNKVMVDFSRRKLSKKIEVAEKSGAKYIVIVGNETKNGMVTIIDIINDTKYKKEIKEL